MNIIVCIKQVPNTADVKIDPKTNTLIREGVESIINPFDAYAIEEAVRLKERFGGMATVITMGPPQAEAALREAISLGCDEAILVSDRAFAGSDTWATSYVLSQAIKKFGPFDIILCGKQASDGDTAQVGPGIATHLDIPQATYVKKIEEINPAPLDIQNLNKERCGVKDKLARVERLIEEGYEVVEIPLPCLLTVVKEINVPRLPSLKGKLKAKSSQIKTWTAKDLECDHKYIGLEGSPTKVVRIFNPPPRKGGAKLTGEPQEMVDKLVAMLKADGRI
jgi:electron transfer flavoprotein beta subunit